MGDSPQAALSIVNESSAQPLLGLSLTLDLCKAYRYSLLGTGGLPQTGPALCSNQLIINWNNSMS